MKIQTISNSNISFKHHHQLKTMFKKGLLPTVKRGFYGDVIDIKNVTLEHLQPVSKGGKTSYSNLVLASKNQNNNRGNKPLNKFVNFKAMCEYLKQFADVKVQDFDGNEYISGIIQKVGEILRQEKR